MPIYVYEELMEDGRTGERIEVQQGIKEPTLTHHPITGRKLRKVMLAPNLGLKHTPGGNKSKLDNKNLERTGFTKYERDKLTGQYHRVVGAGGPPVLKPND